MNTRKRVGRVALSLSMNPTGHAAASNHCRARKATTETLRKLRELIFSVSPCLSGKTARFHERASIDCQSHPNDVRMKHASSSKSTIINQSPSARLSHVASPNSSPPISATFRPSFDKPKNRISTTDFRDFEEVGKSIINSFW